jgi:hypothetical protein
MIQNGLGVGEEPKPLIHRTATTVRRPARRRDRPAVARDVCRADRSSRARRRTRSPFILCGPARAARPRAGGMLTRTDTVEFRRR